MTRLTNDFLTLLITATQNGNLLWKRYSTYSKSNSLLDSFLDVYEQDPGYPVKKSDLCLDYVNSYFCQFESGDMFLFTLMSFDDPTNLTFYYVIQPTPQSKPALLGGFEDIQPRIADLNNAIETEINGAEGYYAKIISRLTE